MKGSSQLLDERERSPLDRSRRDVEGHLRRFFEHKRRETRLLAPEGVVLVDAISDLTLRGGKRVRPALMAAAFASVAPDRDLEDVVEAGAALELLQTYLLIHDDWMDGDAVRRGGHAVHAALGKTYGARLGASLAILAGNLASAYAWELLERGARAEPEPGAAMHVFQRMHREVVVGQHLDLLGSQDVSRMHRLKTGSYTVRGPLDLGAVLGGAGEAQRAALARFGAPLGEAFQLRDDLLGAFGDPARTGKPAGDLLAGRRTSLLAEAEARATPEQRATLLAVQEQGASQADLEAALGVLERSGARAAVESRLAQLLDSAMGGLAGAPLDARGVNALEQLAALLAVRAT